MASKDIVERKMFEMATQPSKEHTHMRQSFCVSQQAIPHTLVHYKDPNFTKENNMSIVSARGQIQTKN